jgi:hypothetical protein
MYDRPYTLDDLTRLLVNRDNPKTMDYYIFRLLNLTYKDLGVDFDGQFKFNMFSSNPYISKSMTMCFRHSDRLSLSYKSLVVLPMFDKHKFPKCRSIKIVSSSVFYVDMINPNRGQTEEIQTYGGFKFLRAQPDYLSFKKYYVCYAHGKWERRGELKVKKD